MFTWYPDWEKTIAAAQLVAFMLAMGAKLTPAQFLLIARQPRSFLVALTGHLLVLPLLAVALVRLAGLDQGPHVGLALGVILVAAMPGGTLAKIFTYFGHGNVALSIALSSVSTLLTLVTVPLMLRVLTRGLPEDIEVPVDKIVLEVAAFLLAPLIVAMAVGSRWPALKKPLERWGVRLGLVLVVIVVVGSVGSGRVQPTAYGWAAPLAIIAFCLLGQQLNQLPFYIFRWPRSDRMAAGMEVTMRNMNLALLLYATVFDGKPDVRNEVLFVILFYAATSLIIGTPLALRHRLMAKRSGVDKSGTNSHSHA